MKQRKSAFEQAQEAALSFAFDEDDNVSVESSSDREEGDLKDRQARISSKNKKEAYILPNRSEGTNTTHEQYPMTLEESISSIEDSGSISCPPEPERPSDKREDSAEFQWARAHALASMMNAGLESSEDDDDFSIASSESEDSASKAGPKPPKRTNNSDDISNEKADELFMQMQIRTGQSIVSRRSLPPDLIRKQSNESRESAQSIQSLPLSTVQHSVSQSYQDPRHRKDYARSRQTSLGLISQPTQRVTRAISHGTSVSSISTSSVKASSVDTEEKEAESQRRQSFLRTMEERLSMRMAIKERRYDEENQQHRQQEEEEEDDASKPPSVQEIVTAETHVVPTSVELNAALSVAETTVHENRKKVRSVLVYFLLGVIAIASVAILVVVLAPNKQEQAPTMEDDSYRPPPTVAPEVLPEQVVAIVPKTICMEQVPGDGWSTQCDAEESILQGGGVCNLVAQSFLNQVEGADIAFQSSTSCLGDIVTGRFTVADAYQILPYNERLWKIQVKGLDILTVLEQVLESTFGIRTGDKRDYPYAAGLRFAVNASAPYQNRVLNPEVNRRLEESAWEPLDLAATYTVVASRNLLTGGTLVRDTPYAAFEQAYKNQYPEGTTWMQTTTTFIEFAEKQEVLRDPPLDTYSTTLFIP